jgi:hypothetical protein
MKSLIDRPVKAALLRICSFTASGRRRSMRSSLSFRMNPVCTGNHRTPVFHVSLASNPPCRRRIQSGSRPRGRHKTHARQARTYLRMSEARNSSTSGAADFLPASAWAS